MRLLFANVLLVLACTFLSSTALATEAAPQKFKIHLVAGNANGSRANSVLIEGANSIFLVDTQRTTQNAERVVEAIHKIGKPVSMVFITHAHPDHFLGSKVIQNAFPNAKFLATSSVLQELATRGEVMRVYVEKSLLTSGSQESVPNEIVMPKSNEGNVLSFEGLALNIIEQGQGESAASAAVYLPDLQALIAGDLIYSGTHLFLAEGNYTDWQKQLASLKKLKELKFIYPGHGQMSDLSIIDKNVRYINDFKAAIETNSTEEEAISKMKRLYPNYAMERFLDVGIKAAFRNKRREDGASNGWKLEREGKF